MPLRHSIWKGKTEIGNNAYSDSCRKLTVNVKREAFYPWNGKALFYKNKDF